MRTVGKLREALLLCALTCAFTTTCYGAAVATEIPQEFLLDEIVVTATRYEKPDVDVPASTSVLTSKDLKNSGAENVQMALQKVPGIQYTTFGPGGNPFGTMANYIIVRGVSNGTLILVNGSPINMSGKYYLDSVPVENVERIEIVKGGGAVLYGSEAMGGVVNIITKKKFNNSVTFGTGNYGQRIFKATFNVGALNIGYNKEKWGNLDDAQTNKDTTNFAKNKPVSSGDRIYDFTGSDKDSFFAEYNFNENLQFLYTYMENRNGWQCRFGDNWKNLDPSYTANPGDYQKQDKFWTKQHIVQLNYIDQNYKLNLFYNQNTPETDGLAYFNTSGLKNTTDKTRLNVFRAKDRAYGVDIQRNWKLGEKAIAIIGTTYKNESYEQNKLYRIPYDHKRNVWGLYGQWEQRLNTKDSFILGARETWTSAAERDDNFSNFSASGQFVHKLGENENVYASIGQSFILPTFTQLYGSVYNTKPSPDLKPQQGINYELGWKKISDGHSWKAAVYHMEIKDNISSTWFDGSKTGKESEYVYKNEDFRNTGIELLCNIENDNGWSFNYGINYGNPQVKESGEKANKGRLNWQRKFGRYQVTGGATYHKDKWSTSLNLSYLADRSTTTSSYPARGIKPYLLTSLSTHYRPDKNSEIALSMDNLLDRKDILSHSGTDYYATPVNFLLSYTYRF